MDRKKRNQLEKLNLSNLQVSNLLSYETRCWPEWREIDCVYAYNKFYYFLEGTGTLIIDGKKYSPRPEELYLIPANTIHSYYNDKNDCFLKYWSHFYAKVQGRELFDHFKTPLRCHLDRGIAESAFNKLVEARDSEDPLMVLQENAALLALIQSFLANVEYELSDKAIEDKTLELAIDAYISEHMGEKITLKALADIAHLHPNYFISYFRKTFSMTPIQYVNEKRLAKSVKMLKSSENHSIDYISDVIGFSDYRYFVRLFKRKYGLTPSDYRKY